MIFNRKHTFILVAVAAICAIAVYGSLDPAATHFPRCPFFVLTGLKCPGCGSQRALHQILHFRLAEAFKYNAALVTSVPILLFLFLSDAFKYRFRRLYRISISSLASWGLVAAVVVWWIVRNVFNW